MNFQQNGQWFDCLPSCEAQVPCGEGRHPVRWEAGALLLPEHPDVEGELVLAALGGEKPGCVEVAEAWQRHGADLSVLAIGPRHPADEIAVSWDDLVTTWPGSGAGPTGQPGRAGLAQHGPMRRPAAMPASMAAMSARRQLMQQEMQQLRERAQRRTNDMLSLLALGYGFQARLGGQVAASYAAEPADERVRPALIAAITGRLAPVAEDWIGIDPGKVVVSLHTGPGWGSVEMTGRGEERRLRVALPAGWLARVWACGLALTGRHLIVDVRQAGWPDARVLAMRAPGAEPVELDVHGSADAGDAPRWEVR
ncbi:MAG: hypothetical protein ACRDPY_27510 [Streptosporangiaceae bacterium]